MEINLGKPSPKQEQFLKDTHKVVIFGGARGGGKSWSGDVLYRLNVTEIHDETELEYLTNYKQLYLRRSTLGGEHFRITMFIKANKPYGIELKEKENKLAYIEKERSLLERELALLESTKPIQDILERQNPKDIIMEFYKEPFAVERKEQKTDIIGSSNRYSTESFEKTNNNDNENDEMIKFWYIPIALIFLFAISIFDLPYGFYTLLRIIVFVLSLFFAFSYYCCKGRLSLISVAAIAISILWNPIIPIYLDKETWVCLDIIACLIEMIMLLFSYKIWKKS